MSPWGISSDGGRQQIKTGLIDKNYGASFALGFFLRTGHFSLPHCSIVVSLRWLARSIGFCRLQPIFSMIRPTCRAEYVTSNSVLISLPARPRIQTLPRKPYASAPRSNILGNAFSCASLSRGFGPPPLRFWSASTPPCWPRLTHWLTAPALTPSASAILFCFQPFCFNFQAYRRRASRHSLACFLFFSVIWSVYFKLTVLFNKFRSYAVEPKTVK